MQYLYCMQWESLIFDITEKNKEHLHPKHCAREFGLEIIPDSESWSIVCVWE